MERDEKRTVQEQSKTARQRLQDAIPIIEEIRTIFQAPSLSIGVRHHGKTIFTLGLGHANRETGRVPDENTVYPIASCTKAFTGTVLSLLAQRGRFSLDAPVSSSIPALDTQDNPKVSGNMTVRDMLSHCAGLATLPFAVIGKNGSVFTSREDVVNIFNHLPSAAPFRSEWAYNNWLYALAGTLIAQEAGGPSFGQMVREEIFDKVGMARSSTGPPADDNHAVPYLVYDNGPAEPTKLPTLVDGDAFDGSGSVRSCVADLLLWSGALIQAWHDEQGYHSDWRDGGVVRHGRLSKALISCLRPLFACLSRPVADVDKSFRERESWSALSAALATVQTPHFPLADDKRQQYALGLFNLKLPTSQMNVVTNGDVNSRNYAIGKDSGERVAIGHTGELGGFLSAYWTFPEDDSSVVVLCNSYQVNGDPTNIVAQLLTQVLFDLRPEIDFTQVARNIVKNARGRWSTVLEKWTAHRQEGTCHRLLGAYTGVFYNPGLAIKLEITVIDDASSIPGQEGYPLQARVNGNADQVFRLRHYHDDWWTFMPESRDECIRQGYSVYLYCWDSFIIKFTTFENGRAGKVEWRLDFDARVAPQLFDREE